MLTSVALTSFKCFEKLRLELKPLTLLSGVNGTGKSSVIQALVLLSQSFAHREWARSLLLESSPLPLGSAADVLSQSARRRSFTIGVSTESEQVQWTFRVGDRRKMSVELAGAKVNGRALALGGGVRWFLPLHDADSSSVVKVLRNLTWIAAERVGPREMCSLLDETSHTTVGIRGELAAGLLYWRGEQRVAPELCLPHYAPTLHHQVRGYMNAFFPGCDFVVAKIDELSAVTLRLRSSTNTEFQRPQNVGFGLTQLFPILVAILGAGRNDVILIENPEVHLHPRAQQAIGSLLCRVVASGTQVIVETHSDHVLNGIRLAAKERILEPDRVAIHFFPAPGSGAPTSSKMDSDGRLDSWPSGFFDQLDLALAALL